MRLVHVLRGALIAFVALGALLVGMGFQLKYYLRTGPGPGFFPIWVGGTLIVFSLAMLVQSLFDRSPSERFFPDREAAWRIFAVTLSLPLTWFGLQYLGFRITMLLFALIVPRIIRKQSAPVTVAIALLASFGVAYAFEHWLGVYLPRAAYEPLERLGL